MYGTATTYSHSLLVKSYRRDPWTQPPLGCNHLRHHHRHMCVCGSSLSCVAVSSFSRVGFVFYRSVSLLLSRCFAQPGTAVESHGVSVRQGFFHTAQQQQRARAIERARKHAATAAIWRTLVTVTNATFCCCFIFLLPCSTGKRARSANARGKRTPSTTNS